MKKLIYLLAIIFLFSCKREEAKIVPEVIKSVKKKEKKPKKETKACSLLPRIKSDSKINVLFSEISEEIYRNGRNKNNIIIKEFSNSDSIENILLKQYPKKISKKDSTLIFKSKTTTQKFINNRIQEKTYSNYSIKGSYLDYIFIVNNFYEGSSTSVLNLKSGKYYSLLGKPTFINDTLFYGYSNYYGDGELVIVDVANEKTISLIFPNIFINESYNNSINNIRFEVECTNSRGKKYIQISNY